MKEIIQSDIFQFLIHHWYTFIFLLAVLEWPIIGFFWAIWAILGYFDIRIIIILSLLWDLIWDSIYYFIWRFSHKVNIKKDNDEWFIKKIGELTKNHPIKAMILVKFTPYMQPPWLIFVWFSKMDLKKFLTLSFALSIPNTLIFVIWGYFFTEKTIALLNAIDIPWLPYVVIPFVLTLVLFWYRKLMKKISEEC